MKNSPAGKKKMKAKTEVSPQPAARTHDPALILLDKQAWKQGRHEQFPPTRRGADEFINNESKLANGKGNDGLILPGKIDLSELPLLVGRAKNLVDVPLNIPGREFFISRKHAAFIQAEDSSDIVVQDLNSTNGLWVNDVKVDYRVLQDGDVIQFGGASGVPVGTPFEFTASPADMQRIRYVYRSSRKVTSERSMSSSLTSSTSSSLSSPSPSCSSTASPVGSSKGNSSKGKKRKRAADVLSTPAQNDTTTTLDRVNGGNDTGTGRGGGGGGAGGGRRTASGGDGRTSTAFNLNAAELAAADTLVAAAASAMAEKAQIKAKEYKRTMREQESRLFEMRSQIIAMEEVLASRAQELTAVAASGEEQEREIVAMQDTIARLEQQNQKLLKEKVIISESRRQPQLHELGEQRQGSSKAEPPLAAAALATAATTKMELKGEGRGDTTAPGHGGGGGGGGGESHVVDRPTSSIAPASDSQVASEEAADQENDKKKKEKGSLQVIGDSGGSGSSVANGELISDVKLKQLEHQQQQHIEQLRQELMSEVMCCLCQSPLLDAAVLLCSHAVCSTCWQMYCADKESKGGSCCPVCNIDLPKQLRAPRRSAHLDNIVGVIMTRLGTMEQKQAWVVRQNKVAEAIAEGHAFKEEKKAKDEGAIALKALQLTSSPTSSKQTDGATSFALRGGIAANGASSHKRKRNAEAEEEADDRAGDANDDNDDDDDDDDDEEEEDLRCEGCNEFGHDLIECPHRSDSAAVEEEEEDDDDDEDSD